MDTTNKKNKSRNKNRRKGKPLCNKKSHGQRLRRQHEKEAKSANVENGMETETLDDAQRAENDLVSSVNYDISSSILEEDVASPSCDVTGDSCKSVSATPLTPSFEFEDDLNDCTILTDETLHPATEVSFEECNSESPLPSGQFICNLAHVIQQARKLEEHTNECVFSGKLIFKKFTLLGLATTLHFECSSELCNKIMNVNTEEKNGCLNQLAVLGALSAGSGFAQEEEKFSTMGIRYMSHPTFLLHERTTGKVLEACVEESLVKAVEEEKKCSEMRNDVDGEGYHCITAIVDGGWCKRSYGHGYNASSGVAVIIGMQSQKILFIGIRNKVCLTCQAIENGKISNKDHLCWKNWDGPSTAMESDIIVEGLRYLENVHKLRCTRLIGDGDVNTMVKVKERVSYGNRIFKVECANHATRRYGKALEKLQQASSRFPTAKGIQARKIMKCRIPRLIKGARASIKNHAVKNHNEINTEAISNLILELRNGPNHVFGKHENCGSFCARKDKDPEESVYNLMKDVGMLQAVMDVLSRIIISCANSLIWNATNNPAENYMSQFCKATGGKRVDFSKGGGINRRANVAVLAYQTPAQEWHASAHKAVTGQSPNTPIRSFLQRRRKLHLKRLNRRKLFPIAQKPKNQHIAKGGDKHYGDQPEQPDMELEVYANLSSEFLSSLSVTTNCEYEELTRGQDLCEKWREERAKRLSSTLFKDVADRRSTTLSAKLVKRICYRDHVTTAAMKYGKANEGIALEAYEHCTKNKVQRCGLFIDTQKPFLCTSPDGLIDDDGLVEIKCPYTARSASNLADICKSHDIGIKLSHDDTFYLPSKHKYFFQIQGQLAITNRLWCDLFVWCNVHSLIIRIERDFDFWNKIVPKLELFYMECILPELIDPRAARGMPLREPQYILNAVLKKNETKKGKKQKPPQLSISPEASTSNSCENFNIVVVPDTACTSQKRIRRPKKIFDL